MTECGNRRSRAVSTARVRDGSPAAMTAASNARPPTPISAARRIAGAGHQIGRRDALELAQRGGDDQSP